MAHGMRQSATPHVLSSCVQRLAELDPDPARTASMVRMTQQQLLLRQRSTVISPDPFGSAVHIATTGGVVTRDSGRSQACMLPLT
jgi:hypothetical protein